MNLLVDIGNGRLKWAGADAGGGLDGRTGALGYDEVADDADTATATAGVPNDLPGLAAQWAALERPASVWVSCVARPEVKRAVVAYAHDAWSLQPVFIAAQKQQAGVVNGYPDPASLGADRWAALVAAAARFPRQPLIVVDAGTAVTVDLLDGDGVFRGGVIFPGVYAMRAALGEQTENITENIAGCITNTDAANRAEQTEQVNATATDTHGAVAGGALLAVAGGINLAVARQRAMLQTPCGVIATGGDAGRIAPLLEAEVRIEPQLVLHGLGVLSKEAAP